VREALEVWRPRRDAASRAQVLHLHCMHGREATAQRATGPASARAVCSSRLVFWCRTRDMLYEREKRACDSPRTRRSLAAGHSMRRPSSRRLQRARDGVWPSQTAWEDLAGVLRACDGAQLRGIGAGQRAGRVCLPHDAPRCAGASWKSTVRLGCAPSSPDRARRAGAGAQAARTAPVPPRQKNARSPRPLPPGLPGPRGEPGPRAAPRVRAPAHRDRPPSPPAPSAPEAPSSASEPPTHAPS